MKTDDLLHLLAADAPVRRKLWLSMTLALLIGAMTSVVILIATVGIRQDIASVFSTSRGLFKIGVTLVAAAMAYRLVLDIGRPGVALKPRALALLAPVAMLCVAVALELFATPRQDWQGNVMGNNAAFCLVFIPVLSIAPLIAFLVALRESAPESAGLAGAAAGLAAGGIAAAIYAWHCADDSPLFVAAWYPVAIAVVTSIGCLMGKRLLRW